MDAANDGAESRRDPTAESGGQSALLASPPGVASRLPAMVGKAVNHQWSRGTRPMRHEQLLGRRQPGGADLGSRPFEVFSFTAARMRAFNAFASTLSLS